MMGVEIGRNNNLKWVWISVTAALLSVGLGIGVGPFGIAMASGIGMVAAVMAMIRNPRQPVAITFLLVHITFLIVALVLNSLFLQPLSDAVLQLPSLSQKYQDPDGYFQIKAPEGWTTETIQGPNEVGVRVRPGVQENYMGVSELTVRVRILEKPTQKPKEFLHQMAKQFNANSGAGKKLFDFSIQPMVLLNGDSGLWSSIVMKRFWVPLYMHGLFGIKGKQYLCSVSTSGIQTHGTLSQVLCLGIFETIRILPKPTENTAHSS